jgi:two-component sensor histidine kinase
MHFHQPRLFAIILANTLLVLTACNKAGSDNAMEVVPGTQGDTATVSSYLKKANSFIQTDYDSLYYYMGLAKNLSIAIGYKPGEARAGAVEANYMRRKGNYAGSIALGLDVVDMYEELKMWEAQVRLKNVLADVYKEMGGEKGTTEYLHKAIELSKQAQQLAEKEKYIAGVVMSLNQQAIVLRDMSERMKRPDLMDSALYLYQQGITIINNTGEGKEELGKFYNNSAQVYNEHYHDYPKALEYVEKAVAFNRERKLLLSLTHNYATLSDVYINMNDLPQANLYAHMMLDLCEELKAPFRKVNAYNALTAVHRKTGRYDSALYYTDLRSALSDSLNNVEKAKQIAETQTKYETGKKEARIFQLDKMNQSKSQGLWLAGGLITLFAALIGISVFQNRRLRKQKAQITEQSNRLQWMMKELHHRVKNNLQIVSSLLNLQTYRLKDEETVSAIKESQLRVQAMSLIHQRLYQVDDVSLVNFKLYLDDLVETLMRSYGYGADDFDLLIQVDKELMDVDTVMPMGLLVNEIITNSFKYAYKEVERPLLHIRLSDNDQQLLLDISDNGPGLSSATEITNKQGFGKKLIAALSKQLKATYTVSSESGTHYQFIIPNPKDKDA